MQADVASASLDAWRAAHNAHALGRGEEAASHTARGGRLCAPGSLLAHAHKTNAAAFATGRVPANAPPALGSGTSPSALFLREIALTSSYNTALSIARGGDIAASLHALDAITAVLALPPAPASLYAHGRAALPADAPAALFRRVAAAAATALQLRAALALLQGATDVAAAANADASLWLRADAALIAPGALEPDAPGAVAAGARAAGRGACIESLTLASTGDLRGAAHCLQPYARTTTHADEELPAPVADWAPTAYQCGALQAMHVLRAAPAARGEFGAAVDVLERCARAGYRAADSRALLARLESSSKAALRAFQAALAVEHERPATLAAAARAFEGAGRHAAQSEILSCLAALPAREAAAKAHGVLCVVEPWIPEDGEVAVARARALLLAKRAQEALTVLESLNVARSADITAPRISTAAAAALGDIEKAVVCAKKLASGFPRAASAQLAVADASLAVEDVNAAQAALERATDIALRENGRVEDGEAAAARAALRGTCYNNRGVLLMCGGGREIGEGGADGMFAAAQVAFDKVVAEEEAGTSVREWVSAAGDAASWNRVLALSASGRVADAASHWIARRGGRGKAKGGVEADFGRAVSHVMGTVDESKKLAMDDMCEGIERAQQSRRRLNEAVREAVDSW